MGWITVGVYVCLLRGYENETDLTSRDRGLEGDIYGYRTAADDRVAGNERGDIAGG
jgi:hypothetical protein